METIMTDIMYEYPAKAAKVRGKYKLTIDADMVKEKTEYKFKNLKEVS